MKLASLLFLAVIGHLHGSPLDVPFSDPRYTKLTELRVTDCRTENPGIINQALAGDVMNQALEIPATNADKPHVSCVNDAVMGPAVQFTIYKDDEDPVTQFPDRQRIEMKVFEASPTSYKATLNTNYVYIWWFKLGQGMVVSDSFFNIFQLKAVGSIVSNLAVFTLSLTNQNGLHMRVNRAGSETLNPSTDYLNLLPLNAVVGKWIQATVEVGYRNSPSWGYVRVLLKSETGRQLVTNQTSFITYRPGADFVRPKWGFHREINSAFQPSDTQRFQNVQIWKRQ